MDTVYLNHVSFAGIDDDVKIIDLEMLTRIFPNIPIEFGILYVPGKEGQPRNASQAWRKQAGVQPIHKNMCVHMCGKTAFEQLLEDKLPEELYRFHKWQLNINARRIEFKTEQYVEICLKAASKVNELVLQYNDDTKDDIAVFMKRFEEVRSTECVSILLDESRGRGLRRTGADLFNSIQEIDKLYPQSVVGIAGGLNEFSTAQVISDIDVEAMMQKVKHPIKPYFIDMESGIRTENKFDILKCVRVLDSVSQRFVN